MNTMPTKNRMSCQVDWDGSVNSNNFRFLSADDELVDDEEIDYEEEESEEDLSDIDDDDLMKRLEAKYGKISGENSEDDEDPEAWTSNYEKLTNFYFLLILIPFSAPFSHLSRTSVI